MKKRILVTGANGYIGRYVVKNLLDMGAEVLAADMRTEGIDPRARIVQEDIFADREGLFTALGSPDACIHLAWKDGFVHNSDAHMACLSSHYRFLRRMLQEGLGQILVMGSMHEVGYWEGAIDENTPCNPISLYGIAKDSLRRALLAMTSGQNVTVQWLRGYYIYGDDERSASIFGKICAAEKQGQQWFPFTTGKNQYDFIEVDQLGKMIAATAMQKEVTGIINCCSGVPVSLADQVESYISRKNMKIRLQYGAFPDRPYDSPGVWGDASKIRRIMEACQNHESI